MLSFAKWGTIDQSVFFYNDHHQVLFVPFSDVRFPWIDAIPEKTSICIPFHLRQEAKIDWFLKRAIRNRSISNILLSSASSYNLQEQQ